MVFGTCPRHIDYLFAVVIGSSPRRLLINGGCRLPCRRARVDSRRIADRAWPISLGNRVRERDGDLTLAEEPTAVPMILRSAGSDVDRLSRWLRLAALPDFGFCRRRW